MESWLAWSKPMSDLAKDFHISDVALAKRCRVVDVPIPYRGYWERKAAGHDPPKLPLPKYRTRTLADRQVPTPSIPVRRHTHAHRPHRLSALQFPRPLSVPIGTIFGPPNALVTVSVCRG
jgi:hypothetical protein